MRVTDHERRARLVARHHLARTAMTVDDVARDLVALHSSDPATPYLSCRARVADFHVEHLEQVLYVDRTLLRLHAMRRTLFVVHTDVVPTVAAAASRDVARAERRRLRGWLAAEVPESDVDRWLAAVEDRLLRVLADGEEWRTQDLTAEVPDLATEVTVGSGRWTTRTPVSSRLLLLLALEGRIVRARPAGTWRSSQYRWVDATAWSGDVSDDADPAAARADLLRRYLAAYGPAATADIRWWTGWSATATTAALDRVPTVRVRLEGEGEGWLLADDQGERAPGSPVVAFLPALDPTPMGWKGRQWYLGDHAGPLFDRNGNVGPTVWLDGRIVGGWSQRADGDVVYRLLEEVGGAAAADIEEEAARLTAWFEGTVVTPRFPTPLARELAS